jgi:hypothetical protein
MRTWLFLQMTIYYDSLRHHPLIVVGPESAKFRSRVDEGCYDPDDHLVMFASPGDSPPFVTFISTLTQKAVIKHPFDGSSSCLEELFDQQ